MLSRFIALCEAEGREYRVAEDMLVLPLESSQVAIRLEEHSMTITGAWEKYFPSMGLSSDFGVGAVKYRNVSDTIQA
ncbi:hypothetical protein ACFQY8_00140, partial [Alloscardovia venturai]